MGVVRFSVKGKVIGSARPRVTRNGTYIPKATREYRKLIQESFRHAGAKKLEGPVAVRLDVMRALPKSRPKKVQAEPDTFKPDADNIGKNFLDALNGLAWDDDAQVVDLHVIKWPRTRQVEKVLVTIQPK